MTDYIDRQAVIDFLQKWIAYDDDGCQTLEVNPDTIFHGIEAIPSAEVVEVVRCKDCRFYDGVAYCEMHDMDVNGNDFCSWAEFDQRRKEQKNEQIYVRTRQAN